MADFKGATNGTRRTGSPRHDGGPRANVGRGSDVNDASSTPNDRTTARAKQLPGTTALCLSIAGLCLHYRGAGRLRLAAPDKCYSTFLRASPADGPCIDTVDMEVVEGEVPRPDLLSAVADSGDSWSMLSDERRHVFQMKVREETEVPDWSITVDRGFNHGRIYCSDKHITPSGKSLLAHDIICNPLDKILVIHMGLARSSSMLLNAAGGSIDGQGVLFAGASGTGKSTISRLLSKAPNARFLSDDRIVLRRFGSKLSMYGTPWPGDAGVAVNESVPLKAICFLRHGNRTALTRLDPEEAHSRLTPVTSVPWHEPTLADRAKSLCDFLVERYPAFDLSFRPESDELESVMDDFSHAA